MHDDIFPYEVVIWEKMPAGLPISQSTHMTLADVGYDFGLSGKMEAITEKHESVLLVIETVNMLYLLPWISALEEKKNVTIVTTSAGVASYMSKSQPEMSDVTLVMPYMHV